MRALPPDRAAVTLSNYVLLHLAGTPLLPAALVVLCLGLLAASLQMADWNTYSVRSTSSSQLYHVNQGIMRVCFDAVKVPERCFRRKLTMSWTATVARAALLALSARDAASVAALLR